MTSPRDADVIELRATVERLAAENATLRDQLDWATSALPAAVADTPITKTATASPRRRRWIGNAIGVLLLFLGFAFGALFAARKAPETAAEFRRGYNDGAAAARAAKGAPVASPTPITPAAANQAPAASPLP